MRYGHGVKMHVLCVYILGMMNMRNIVPIGGFEPSFIVIMGGSMLTITLHRFPNAITLKDHYYTHPTYKSFK